MKNITRYDSEVLTALYASLDYAQCEGTQEEASVINSMIVKIENKYK
jgi:hypothetical protein